MRRGDEGVAQGIADATGGMGALAVGMGEVRVVSLLECGCTRRLDLDDGQWESQEVIFDGLDNVQWFKQWACRVDGRVEEGVGAEGFEKYFI